MKPSHKRLEPREMSLQTLSVAEEQLLSRIKGSDVPFLGLLRDFLSPAIQTTIELLTLAQPTVEQYREYLWRHPALFSVNLTAHVMEGMGRDGHFDLYPHVERAIGTDVPLTQSERESLWTAFRKAIQSLGFEASPRKSGNHYMATEYLRQVGVPLAFADDLAERMLNFAKRVGLPDQDDPEAIKSWQQALQALLKPPFSVTAQKGVTLDTEGYYTQVFLRVYHRGGQADEQANAIERAMARAFQKYQPEHGGILRRAQLPYLMLNDGLLGIFIPGGDEREHEISVDGEVRVHRSSIEDAFVPLKRVLAREVEIKDRARQQASTCRLWEDKRPNRLLVFSDSGRFKVAAQLNQPDPVLLPPGQYTCLSRFCPSGFEAEALWDDPSLYALTLDVLPGQVITLANGPAALTIQGESQPYLSWSASSSTTKEGTELRFGELKLHVEFPAEWSSFSGRRYVLRLSSSGSARQLRLPFELDDSNTAEINLTAALQADDWPSGPSRLLAEISRADEARSLIRSAILYWHGLTEIRRGMTFMCKALPANLEQGLNENVRIDGDMLKPRDSLAKTFRLVFRLDERRHQVLTWNVPGIFIEVENDPDGGTPARISRPVGAIESVSLTSNKQLFVSATDPGTLSIGDWSLRVDFSKYPTKRLSASLLASRMTPQGSTLTYLSDRSGIPVDLLRLVQPHFVRRMTTKACAGQFVVRFLLPRELQAIRVIAADVVSGQDIDIVIGANAGNWAHHRFGKAQFMCLDADEGGYAASVFLHLELWPAGAWVFRFDGQIDGAWGHLENERQDLFAAGLLCNDRGAPVGVEQLLGCLTDLTGLGSLEVLRRVQAAMHPCYAQEAWDTMQWLTAMWHQLLRAWSGRENEAVTALVDLATARPPEDANPTWMLQLNAAAQAPRIYALPAREYRQVNLKPYPLVEALRAASELERQYPFVFPDLMHLSVASAFKNFAQMAQGAKPYAFDLDKYVEALQQTNDQLEVSLKLENDAYRPGAGDWLGPVHYRFAWRALEAAYDRTLGGNEIRRGQAIGLCRFFRQRFPSFNHDYHRRLVGKSPHIVPWPSPDDDSVSPEVAQKRENLAQFSHLLSALAYHCRLGSRQPGRLDEFIGLLKTSAIPVAACLTYLLQVGEAMFAYYLLLWEIVQKADETL